MLQCTEVLLQPDSPTAYELPDGNIFTVGVKRSRHAELLGFRQSGVWCPPPHGEEYQMFFGFLRTQLPVYFRILGCLIQQRIQFMHQSSVALRPVSSLLASPQNYKKLYFHREKTSGAFLRTSRASLVRQGLQFHASVNGDGLGVHTWRSGHFSCSVASGSSCPVSLLPKVYAASLGSDTVHASFSLAARQPLSGIFVIPRLL